MLNQIIVSSLIVNLSFVALSAPPKLNTSLQSDTNVEKIEIPRSEVELDFNLTANLIVKYEGQKTSISGGFKCPQHKGGKASKKNINQTIYQRVDFANFKMLQNSTKAKSSQRIQPNQPVTQNPYGNSQKKNKFPSPFLNDRSNGFRSISVSNKVTNKQNGGLQVHLQLKDIIKKTLPNTGSSRCWRREPGTAFKPGKDTIDGTLQLTYQVPKNVKFLKVQVPKATNLFQSQYFKAAEGAMHSQLSYSRPQYMWLTVDNNLLPEDRRIKFIFNYKSQSDGVGLNGHTNISELKLDIDPVNSAKANLSYAQRLDLVTQLIKDPRTTEDQLVSESAYLIEHSDQLDSAVRNLSLADLREIQNAFFDFAIRGTSVSQKLTPFTKAMAAVVTTKISENLSRKLLPVCVIEEKTLPVLGEKVELQRYVYLMFYLNRILDRLKYYEPLHAFSIIAELEKLQKNGATYLSVANDGTQMKRLSKIYRVYLRVHSSLNRPAKTSYGEYMELKKSAGEFMNLATNEAKVAGLLLEGETLEDEIYVELQALKRKFIRNAQDASIETDILTKNLNNLNAIRKDVLSELDKLLKSHIFSELSVEGFSNSMFSVFEGLGLATGKISADKELISYYTPIFNYYFNAGKMQKLAEQTQLCLSGQLRENK